MNDALGLPQSILVLGGSSEIARATVRALLAKRPARVVLGGREASLAEAAQECRQRGAIDVSTVVFDAANPASLTAAIDEAFGKGTGQHAQAGPGPTGPGPTPTGPTGPGPTPTGPTPAGPTETGPTETGPTATNPIATGSTDTDIDLVIVAFGVLGDQAVFDADPGAAAHAATVNYTSAVVAGLRVAHHMKAQGHGTILALSSVAGERVRKANFVYGSTKAGLDGFYQGLGDSLDGTGPHVVIVRPGFVKSRMTAGMKEAPFATDPDAVAALIVKGLAKGSPIIWAPPILKIVFAVFRHLPRGLWRKVPG